MYVIHDKKQLYAFVFEKGAPVRTGKIVNENKDGIHIMFPYLSTEAFWEFKIRDGVLSRCKEVFGDLKLSNLCKTIVYKDVIDKAVIDRNNWQMYGSRKPNCQVYKLTHILSIKDIMNHSGDVDTSRFHSEPLPLDELKSIELVEVPLDSYTKRTLLELLSIRNRTEETLVKESMKQLYSAELEKNQIEMEIKGYTSLIW